MCLILTIAPFLVLRCSIRMVTSRISQAVTEMDCDVRELDRTSLYKLLTGSVLPRPIAWLSTQDLLGVANLAPFSFFTVAGLNPPMLAVTILKKPDGSDKDSLANIRATGEFVVNIVTQGLVEEMNQSCAAYPAEVDEFDLAGLEKVRSKQVKAPGVARSPVRYECVLHSCLDLGHGVGGSTLVLGEIRHVHATDTVYQEGRVDVLALHPIGKLAGDAYTLVHEDFSLERP
jgi:flavin reductase (DIM6/NTAB) family NADH-FMN oxidoreductase RutF